VSTHRALYPIATMCRALGVSTSGYYAWSARSPSARATSDAALLERIDTIHAASRGTYGSPRIHAELVATGRAVGRKRVARLMKGASLRGVCRRRFVTTTVRDSARQAPDLVDRSFVAAAPNVLWVADITYVSTWSGFLYLAVVLDVFSRRVVGWSMSTTLQTELVLAALNMALAVRQPRGVIHHSDQGSQYTSLAFGKRCREMGVLPSMGSVGDAYDNAMAESFFATLECELLARHRFKTQAEARSAIFQFIEGFYNPRRRHSALGYLSPAEFERRHARTMPSSPGTPKSAGVLAAVKDKPLRAHPYEGRVLDSRCARRPTPCAGRDEGTGSCGAEQRNITTKEGKTSSHHMQ
jgi:putative transposase